MSPFLVHDGTPVWAILVSYREHRRSRETFETGKDTKTKVD